MQTLNQAEPTKSRVRTDFDGLLRLAEETQSSLEDVKGQRSRLEAYWQGLGFAAVSELLLGYFVTTSIWPSLSSHVFSARIGSVFLIFDLLFGILTLLLAKRLLTQLRHTMHSRRTYERDLSEIVELLREIEPVVAKEEDLSVLDRVQIRIRLSRFGVGQSLRETPKGTAKDMKEDFLARKQRVDQELAKPF